MQRFFNGLVMFRMDVWCVLGTHNVYVRLFRNWCHIAAALISTYVIISVSLSVLHLGQFLAVGGLFLYECLLITVCNVDDNIRFLLRYMFFSLAHLHILYTYVLLSQVSRTIRLYDRRKVDT